MTFYQHHEVLVSMAFFGFGFIFDILTIGRIDDALTLIQQASYLIILGTFLLLEIKFNHGRINLSYRLNRIWKYHNLIVHFLFGSLLSIYTIFYFTSASAITSFLFILLLVLLMVANEIPKIRQLGLPVRVILYNICVLSFFLFLYPIILGHIGPLPFWLGLVSSFSVMLVIWILNFKGHDKDSKLVKKYVLFPTMAIHGLFLLAYYTSLIPPVPVAIKKIGVYYGVTKEDGHYIGQHLNSNWNFWSNGSQEFKARKGDKITILLSIFSPTSFKDQVYLKWYRHDENDGWILEDTIPLNILGGRDQGFRGFGTKQYYSDGDWKVVVETSDEREVGRIKLKIINDQSINERTFSFDVF